VTTTRQLISKRFEDRFEPLDDFTLPGIAADITADIRADKLLLDAYVTETLYTLVYSEGMQVLGRQRLRSQQAKAAATAAAAPPSPAPWSIREQMRRGRLGQQNRLRWLNHTEYVDGRHVKLMALTKEQIPLAIAARMTRRDAEERRIRLLRECDTIMQAGEQIGDRHSADRLEEMFQAICANQPIPPQQDGDDGAQQVAG